MRRSRRGGRNGVGSVPAPPVIVSVSPTSFATSATAFTITGTGLSGATALTLGGTTCTSIVVVSDTSITAVSPAKSAASYNLVVTTPAGTYTFSIAVAAAPTVSSVVYTVTDTAGGTANTLTGTNLTGATLALGGTACTSVVVVNSTTVTFKDPAKTAGLHDLVVTTLGGTATLSNAIEAWRPTTDGTNLKLWIRADLGVTQSGGTVSLIADQSGNGKDFSGATVQKPTVNATGVNGLQTLDFNGTSNKLTCAAGWTNIISTTASTMLVGYVPNAYTTTSANTYACDAVICDPNGYYGLYQKPTSTIMGYEYHSGDIPCAVAGPAAGSAAVVTHRHFGGNMICTVNGGTPVSVTAAAVDSLAGIPTLGFGLAYCNMKFREVMVWNIDVGATILAKAQKYLNSQMAAY